MPLSLTNAEWKCFWLQELYHELHALDRFEQDYRRKLQEEDNSNAAQRGKLGLVSKFTDVILVEYFGIAVCQKLL